MKQKKPPTPDPDRFFRDLLAGERFTLNREENRLIRERRNTFLPLDQGCCLSFSLGKFITIYDWIAALNQALALSGWRLAWYGQRVRYTERTPDRREVDELLDFSPGVRPDAELPPPTLAKAWRKLLPEACAVALILRAERLPRT